MALSKKKQAKQKAQPKLKPSTKNALLGTALIGNLVNGAITEENDRPALEAIRDSAWSYLLTKHDADQKAYWISAAILAAYTLGKEGLKIPINGSGSQNPEKPKS